MGDQSVPNRRNSGSLPKSNTTNSFQQQPVKKQNIMNSNSEKNANYTNKLPEPIYASSRKGSVGIGNNLKSEGTSGKAGNNVRGGETGYSIGNVPLENPKPVVKSPDQIHQPNGFLSKLHSFGMEVDDIRAISERLGIEEATVEFIFRNIVQEFDKKTKFSHICKSKYINSL